MQKGRRQQDTASLKFWASGVPLASVLVASLANQTQQGEDCKRAECKKRLKFRFEGLGFHGLEFGF